MEASYYDRGKTFMEELAWEMKHQQLYVNESFFQHGLQANKIYFDEEAMRLVYQALLNEFLQTDDPRFLALAQYLEHKSHTKSFLKNLPSKSGPQEITRMRKRKKAMF
ncbi:hypothetical protein [Laceyella putida]|uniref:Uncharacterized protein n=1 Tax=Laceyella putida TaxID=110101 RepID=A0ABW2RMN1_9BACL